MVCALLTPPTAAFMKSRTWSGVIIFVAIPLVQCISSARKMQVEILVLTFVVVFSGIYGISSAFLARACSNNDDQSGKRMFKSIRKSHG
jgi:hypothetical protein